LRASDGKYYPGLDHLRALAAFLVFGWHFTHGANGTPAAFGPSATPFFAPFNEGHCGVALFMCLSGYLFAKILDGKEVIWPRFYWNRFLRLIPLLLVVFVIRGVRIAISHPDQLDGYLWSLVRGFIGPDWPNGGWSIAIEIHFYLLLWIIIPLNRRWPAALFGILALSLATRTSIFLLHGDVEQYAYWTLIGRIDQFTLGIMAWQWRAFLRGRHVSIGVAALAFFAFYQWFATIGGYYGTHGPRAVWIFIPTIEAAFFSFLVAYYDTTFSFSRSWYWRALEAAGAASFSIYLLHMFVVFRIADWAQSQIPAMATWEVAEGVGLLTFALVAPIAWLSYRYFESPFLRLRVRYTSDVATISERRPRLYTIPNTGT
jgi:peptidoglycan/LPS O-acetylase OafA/YrhL